MTDPTEVKQIDLGAYIENVSAFIGLPVPETSKPIIIANLEIAQRMFSHLADFDMDEREEPAPVFRP